MKYCKKCLQPDTRPNIVFKDGICPVCRYSDTLESVDWKSRFSLLESIIDPYRNTHCNSHDCIVGVSGGKDSTRQALWVRDKLRMNPLLVALTQPPEQVSEIGVHNLSNLLELGFDVVQSSLSPQTWKSLVRHSFFNYKNWAKPTELAIFSAVPRLAIQYNIPLVFWGECPLQVGDLGAVGSEPWDANNMGNSNTLASGHQWMLDSSFKNEKLIHYKFPTQRSFQDSGVQIVYLGWFLGDWGLERNASNACSYGLRVRDEGPLLTGDLKGVSNLDEDWHNMNQMMKFLKFGFGKVTEYVCESIRLGAITRDEGIPIIEKYDGKISSHHVLTFCSYIGISESEFWNVARSAVNSDLFDIKPNNIYTPKFKVGLGL